MKTSLLAAFLFISGFNVILSQQYSEMYFDPNTSIEVLNGADICADDIIIQGLFSGGGTLCGGALPVTLSSFTHSVEKNNVTLFWSTVMELNNSGFDIERKFNTNGASWIKTGFVKGFGTTDDPKEYSFNDPKLQTGSYFYRLKQIDYNGNFEYFLLSDEVIIAKPGGFALGQNYPNPSNPKCKIDFQVPYFSFVNISVFNLLGQLVIELVNAEKEPGHYTAEFDGSNHPSGTYFYRITGDGFTDVKKMTLVK